MDSTKRFERFSGGSNPSWGIYNLAAQIDCLQTQYSNIVFLCSLKEIDNFCPSTGTAF